MKTDVSEPVKRGRLRQILGKEYYIARRAIGWRVEVLLGRKVWARQMRGDLDTAGGKFFEHVVFEHRSLILRKLAGVNMQLQENKRRNLELAIAHLNGMVIRQGETFSVWKNVGRPTRAKGYLEGLVLVQGKLSSGVGGGICQLGNLLFWLFAHSPLKVTERFRHGFDVFPDVSRKVPFGAGATLSYNYIDLQVLNRSMDDFKVELWMDEDFLYGRLLCENPLEKKYRVEERNHLIRQQYWGGYSRHNEIVKVVTDREGRESEELLVKNDAIMMYAPLLEDRGEW